MTSFVRRPENDLVPLIVGYWYLLLPGYPSGQWVIITAIDSKYVYASGLFNNKADLKCRIKQFDDNVTEAINPATKLSVYPARVPGAS